MKKQKKTHTRCVFYPNKKDTDGSKTHIDENDKAWKFEHLCGCVCERVFVRFGFGTFVVFSSGRGEERFDSRHRENPKPKLDLGKE